jgi:type IV pilus assembly protein PilB
VNEDLIATPAETPADPARRGQRRHLGEVLIEQGVITPDQLDGALKEQRVMANQGRRVRLGRTLVERGHVTDRQIAEALAHAMSLRMIDVSSTAVPPNVGRMLPRNLAERHLVVPISLEGDKLVAAFADPTNVIALDDLKLYTGVTDIEVVVAVESQVRETIANAWAMS